MLDPSAPSRHIWRWVLGGGLVVLLTLGGAAAVFARDWLAIPGMVLQMTGQQVADTVPAAGPVLHVAPNAAPAPGAASISPNATAPALDLTAPQTDDSAAPSLLPNRPFTVLLLGSDNDLKFAPEAVLTQSMILVRIDPATHQVAMVSIPRDFWVPIAGYGYQKIDVAYEVGGIATARKTVEQLFGVHVDYYAWVGLNGLVQVIDTVGGVDVTVLHPVLDEMYPDDLNSADPYSYFRLYIPAGPQHLDGTTALQYVRSRHGDLQSDFGRSVRQQQVLLALKNDLQDPSVAGKLPQLVNSLKDAVKTDMTVPALGQLALLGRKVTSSDIQRQVLAAPQFASLGNSPDGAEQVVYPDWPAIRGEMAQLFDLHDPGVSDDLAQQVWQENVPIQVLNATGQDGLANQFSQYLTWQGYQVAGTGNSSQGILSASQVIVQGPTTGTAKALAAMLQAPITTSTAGGSSPSVTVVLGLSHPSIPAAMLSLPDTSAPPAPAPTMAPSPPPATAVPTVPARTSTPAGRVPTASPHTAASPTRAPAVIVPDRSPTPAPAAPRATVAAPATVVTRATLPPQPVATNTPAPRLPTAVPTTAPAAPARTPTPRPATP